MARICKCAHSLSAAIYYLPLTIYHSDMEPTFIPPVANPQRARRWSSRILIIAVALVVMMVIGVGLVIAMQTNSPTTGYNTLNAEMDSLSAMLAQGVKSARRPEVLKASTDASIVIASDVVSLKAVTDALGVKANKQIAATEKTAHDRVMADLSKAAIDSRFDSAYVPEVLKKLDSVTQQLKAVSATARPSSRAVLQSTLQHIDITTQAFQAITL